MLDAAKASADILNSQFNKKFVLIKEKKTIKIKNLLLELKKITKLKSKLVFLNKTQRGHYDKKPKPFKKFKTYNYYRKDSLDYKKGLLELVESIKPVKF